MQTEPVVTRYSADAGPLLAELEKIRSAQLKYGASVDNVVGRLDQQNKQLENSIAKWAKIGVGIAAISKAIDYGGKAWEAYGNQLRLTEAAAGVNIAALDKAVAGQLEHMDLLKLAAELNNGALKLTQEQMEDVAGAIRQLAREGEDATEVSKAFANFIGSGQTRALTQYGIGVDEAGKKTKNLSDVFGEIRDRAAQVEGASLSMGEAQKAVSNDVKDSFTRIRTAIGELVDGLAPLIEKFAALAEVLAKIPSVVKDIGTTIGEAFASLFMSDEEMMYAELEKQGGGASGRPGKAALTAAFEIIRPTVPDVKDKGKRSGGGGGGVRLTIGGEVITIEPNGGSAAGRDFGTGGGMTGFGTLRQSDIFAADEWEAIRALRDSLVAPGDGFTGRGYDAGNAERSQSKLAQMFGPIEEIDAYATAFGMLQGAVSSAMTAWIDGSMSAGAAIKAFFAEAIKGLAVNMAMQALQHGAYALGSLAFGDLGGAARHGKAAAAFAAGAVLAAGAAKGLAPAAGGAVGGAASTSTATGGGSSGGGRDRTIVIGDAFADDSPRMRQRKAQRLVALADREGSGAARYS